MPFADIPYQVFSKKPLVLSFIPHIRKLPAKTRSSFRFCCRFP